MRRLHRTSQYSEFICRFIILNTRHGASKQNPQKTRRACLGVEDFCIGQLVDFTYGEKRHGNPSISVFMHA